MSMIATLLSVEELWNVLCPTSQEESQCQDLTPPSNGFPAREDVQAWRI